MNTTIEKVGPVYQLRCKYHGAVNEGSDRSLIEDLKKQHDAFCEGPQHA